MVLRKAFIVLAASAALVVAAISPCLAARAIQGSVAEVSAADAAALGSVGFRIWSGLPGGTTLINQNTLSCRGVRCLRTYVTNSLLNPGGYVGNQEATQVYNGDLPDQWYYELVDASLNDSAGNHIGYYGLAGVTGNNAGVGNFLAANCAGATATNCFGRLDSSQALPPLSGTNPSYGGPAHTIRAIGGLNPIPNVRVAAGGLCTAGSACLSWNDPAVYTGAMRPSNIAPAPPSAVLGVRIWKNDRLGTCTDPSGDDPGWSSLAVFPLGTTSYEDVLPTGPACRFYALGVRLVGPGGSPNEIETFRVGPNSQPVNISQTAVRITRFDVHYSGHGVVDVSWQSGIEGDVSGFYVTRAVTATGPFERVSSLVQARGDGNRYRFADRVSGAAARTFYYQLAILGRDGTVTTSATAGVTLPQRTRTRGPSIR